MKSPLFIKFLGQEQKRSTPSVLSRGLVSTKMNIKIIGLFFKNLLNYTYQSNSNIYEKVIIYILTSSECAIINKNLLLTIILRTFNQIHY